MDFFFGFDWDFCYKVVVSMFFHFMVENAKILCSFWFPSITPCHAKVLNIFMTLAVFFPPMLSCFVVTFLNSKTTGYFYYSISSEIVAQFDVI